METQTLFDPVSRHVVVPSNKSISSVYQGRAYYFESRENRDSFETSPDKYLAGSPGAGQPVGQESVSTDRPARRGGC